LGWVKTLKKLIKSRKPEKKLKKPNREKKPIKSIKILKKPTGSFRFLFYKSETKKTEPNRIQTEKTTETNWKNRAKLKNWAKPVWTGFCPKNKLKQNRSVW
jgi:hypothetical protein